MYSTAKQPLVSTPNNQHLFKAKERSDSPASVRSYGTEPYDDNSPRSTTGEKNQSLTTSSSSSSSSSHYNMLQESPDTIIIEGFSDDVEKDEARRMLNFSETAAAAGETDWRKNGKLIPTGEGATLLSSSNNVDDSSTTPVSKKELLEDLPAMRSAIFCVIPLFMGYACLFSLQGKIKDAYGITTKGERFDQFGNAVSFLYMGNLVFRFAHNLLFFCFSPRIRVVISMVCMMASLNVLLWGVFICKLTNTLAWVYVAYALGQLVKIFNIFFLYFLSETIY